MAPAYPPKARSAHRPVLSADRTQHGLAILVLIERGTPGPRRWQVFGRTSLIEVAFRQAKRQGLHSAVFGPVTGSFFAGADIAYTSSEAAWTAPGARLSLCLMDIPAQLQAFQDDNSALMEHLSVLYPHP